MSVNMINLNEKSEQTVTQEKEISRSSPWIGYGILEKEGVFSRLQNQTIPQAYVFEWDKKKRITINPLSPLENLNENFNSEYCLGLLKVRF